MRKLFSSMLVLTALFTFILGGCYEKQSEAPKATAPAESAPTSAPAASSPTSAPAAAK